MADDDDRRAARARFLRELATRDLYAWFGIPRDADAATIREAAARMRARLHGTPMPAARRATERAFCDQGEKALLRPDVRRQYDALLAGPAASALRAEAATRRERDEREARLRAARERIQRYAEDDGRMAPGSSILLAGADARAALEDERRAAAGVEAAADALTEARRARMSGATLRALAHAERAHALSPSPATLRTLGAARRDAGDLAGSEAALREGVRLLPTVRENAPGWTALAATLRARGALDEAAGVAQRVVDEHEEDAHGWRVMALIDADRGDTARSAEAWERSAALGLDPPGALSGLQELRKAALASGDQAAAASLELRISRMRR
jgi:hypothetical protein